MSEIRVTKQTTVTFYGSIKLEDLRAFLQQCEGISGTAPVRVTHYRGDQRDPGSTTITVMDAE